MLAVVAVFAISLILALFLTPLAAAIGQKLGAIDVPDDRKVHKEITPRSGGIAIVIAFFLSLAFMMLFGHKMGFVLHLKRELIFLLLGSLVIFGIGVWDDFKRLNHKIKFIFQLIGATIAFYGGIRIDFIPIWGVNIQAWQLSYLITIFWFILFINAINLIDGLDGLAAGIVFFASIVMMILAIVRSQYLIALLFAALSGSTLGFLYYNFNPAKIFMGDGGSYFLGYTIAGLSVMGSVKSQVSAAILTPLVALGIPIFDTILSPVRRFILGQGIFYPDGEHIHHKLLAKGLSTRKAVLVLYGVSVVLSILAIILVNVRDKTVGLVLLLIIIPAFLLMHKIGYFNYITPSNIYVWLKALGDEAGLTHERRSFLRSQIEISTSKDFFSMWENIVDCLKMLKFDLAELYIFINTKKYPKNIKQDFSSCVNTIHYSKLKNKNDIIHYVWTSHNLNLSQFFQKDGLLKIEIPLLNEQGKYYGFFWLVKDMHTDPIGYYSLKRVEHLRRSIIRCLDKIY